jgi:hypothetical protein
LVPTANTNFAGIFRGPHAPLLFHQSGWQQVADAAFDWLATQ